MFAFTEAQPSRADLYEWQAWFSKKGVITLIEPCKGGYVLLVAGEEADTSKHNSPEPRITNCIYCGKAPPHGINHFRYCDDMCQTADYERRRKA